ncbi:hypothetical protein F5144DRAFT_489514 [Chaetomium tenue]|uniref:Uncharacterized protein n=1 Tax=Chaetomium tenue TaxID=1854479 RepID=A0ACB7P884_9PEZI|nr:hypothetical protein F5144DRAFT_489514 [Chaetomium globosum]
MGDSWAYHLQALNEYVNGPTVDGLIDRGRWGSLVTKVKGQARALRQLGLAPWNELAPETKERLSSWSPVAKQLWESDFTEHRDAMVRAWIWHYLDDNLFSFAGGIQEQSLVPLSSPVWEHFRAFRRDLNVLLHDPKGFDNNLYQLQFYSWSRMAEHLVRKGLGQPDSVKAGDLVPHYKKHLRLIIQDGGNKLPDDAHDGDLEMHYGDVYDSAGGPPHWAIREVAKAALVAQYYVHGTKPGSYTLRFSPIGCGNIFGFHFDEDWMKLSSPIELPSSRPDSEEFPNVQLVSDPMLVVSGLDGLSYDKEFTCCAPMVVVAPWTFGGEEAAPFIYPGFEKGWEEALESGRQELRARMKKVEEDAKAGAEGADGPANNTISEAPRATQNHAPHEGKSEEQAEQLKD